MEDSRFRNIIHFCFKDRNAGLLLSSILIAVLLLRFFSLGSYPIIDTTESRYAEIGKEIVASGNWIMPSLEGKPFWAKPPLSMWLIALSFKVFGISEFSARFPSFLLSIFTLLLTIVFGTKIRNKSCGIICGIILSTTGLFYVLAGGVMTDPCLMASVTLSMVGFSLSLKATNNIERFLWGLSFFAGLGLSLLAKGPVGLLLTLLPILIWIIWKNQFEAVKKCLPWFAGILLTIAIGIPWYILGEIKTPGFLKYFLIEEHFSRFFIEEWEGDMYGSPHSQPIGTIWVYLLMTTFPWVFIFIGLILKKKNIESNSGLKNDIWFSFSVLWMLSSLIIFTIARNILPTYIATSLPGFALALTMMLENHSNKNMEDKLPWFCSKKVLIPSLFITPLLFCFLVIPYIRSNPDNYSKKNLIQFLNTVNRPNLSDLIFINNIPYSAQFYSKEQIYSIDKSDIRTLIKKLNDNKIDYFAISKRDITKLSPIIKGELRDIRYFGKYLLLREIKN